MSEIRRKNAVANNMESAIKSTKAKPSEAGSAWKGGATECVRDGAKTPSRTIWSPRRRGGAGSRARTGTPLRGEGF